MRGVLAAAARFGARLRLAARIARSVLRLTLSGSDRLGKHPVIYGRARFWLSGTTVIGDRFRADGLAAQVSIMVAPGARLSIGDDVYLNGGVCIEAWHDVRIGSNVLFAPFAAIVDDDRHELEPGAPLYKGPVVIGDNAWLGRGAVILPGVTIGAGSAVGANSVVTRDIPPQSFAAGAPARVIRKLDLPSGWVRR
jgi:acetyltransferase-like isoleucine patch superfamily enzyme